MDKGSVQAHFDSIADRYDYWKHKNRYYQSQLQSFFGKHVLPGDAVVEFGCGTGDIVASLSARRRLGIDFSSAMVERARAKHPDIEFLAHDVERPLASGGEFDVVVMADLVDHVSDIPAVYRTANRCLKKGGRMVISSINPVWDPVLSLAEKFGMKMPEGEHNFVPNRALAGFLGLAGFRLVSSGALMLLPKRVPLFSDALNAVGPRLPLLHRLCAVQTLVAVKTAELGETFVTNLKCSVLVPCLNEEANIVECIRRIPNMGAGTEIVVVDDGSTDKTAALAEEEAGRDARVRVVSYRPNKGKGYAVVRGANEARGEIVMILDADMTVPPEELPLFFNLVAQGGADFANGTRMVYPMEEQSMRFLNLIGNFVFGVVLSWLLSQRITDTLCGTKALRKADFMSIQMGGDSWGDFDLLFGAAEMGLRIAEVPVHYKARTAGVSKMRPFKHCLVLLGVCWTGFVRLKLGAGRRSRK